MRLKIEVLMDKKENPRKCTVHPLRERPDFRVRYFHNGPIEPFDADWLLHVDGRNLADMREEKVGSLGVIDCTWRKVPSVLQRLGKPLPRLVRIPEGFRTAYPRKNKAGKDPDTGLATIEAIFIAAAFCGKWDESLLEHYHFGEEFLALNEAEWERYDLRS